MKPKNLITALLLLFVVASVAVLAAKGLRRGPSAAAEPTMTDGVVAYYFHGKTRCPTCQSIEAYAQEAISTGFADQLDDGRLQWQVVNYELAENEHFATEYELIAPTVVLVEMDGGKQKQWKNLARVWELVHDDKAAFVKYVQEETRNLLGGAST